MSQIGDSSNDNIVAFESFEEYQLELRKSLKRTPEERKAWEQEHGIVSFGTKCNELYDLVADMEFESQAEIFAFVEKNNKYLKMVKEEHGDYSMEVINESNPNRYLANANGMFQVKSNIFKTIEKGLVYSSLDNYEIISHMDNEQAKLLPEESDIRVLNYEYQKLEQKSTTANCGYGKKQRTQKNGKNRTIIQLNLRLKGTDIYDESLEQTISFEVIPSCYLIVRPQKRTWGAWLLCKRTISCNISVNVNCQNRYGGWTNAHLSHIKGNYYSSKYEEELDVSEDFAEYCKDYHYIKYYAWGDTPSTSRALLNCGN